MNHKKSHKLFIVPAGGIGNRLRALVSGIWLAHDAGFEPVVVWHPDALCQAALSDIISLDAIPAKIVIPGSLAYSALFEVPRRRNLWLPSVFGAMKFKRCYYDDVNLLPYLEDCPALLREVQTAGGDVLFFSGQEYYDFPRGFFRRIINPAASVIARADEILGGKMPDLAIQIRRTDNEASIALSPEERFVEIVESNPDALFFLATDSQAVKSLFIEHFGHRILTNSEQARRDSREGIVDAMAEIVIMSRTKKIYASYASSFPHIASWLREVPIEVIKKLQN